MRLFAALELPDNIQLALDKWWIETIPHLGSAWRQVPSKNWHITLAFYGDIHQRSCHELSETLEEISSDIRPFRLRLNDFGVFPRAARPRVFWAGVQDVETHQPMLYLARRCHRAGQQTLKKNSAKRTPFIGHVTLARCRDVNAYRAGNDSHWGSIITPPAVEWTADSLTLFSSKLKPDGAHYQALAQFSF